MKLSSKEFNSKMEAT